MGVTSGRGINARLRRQVVASFGACPEEMPAKQAIAFEELQRHFHLPMAEVAKRFGVCTTFFKKACRAHGIKRWPFRKVCVPSRALFER